jgi:hypothetical protein
VLSRLPQATGAAFDSHAEENGPRCHPATRIDLLKEIQLWVEEPTGHRIFWLNGMAGTGKSTISRTFARSFDDRGLLGASFFFKSGEGDRGNALRFFTTIAAQLTVKVPELIPHIAKVLELDPDVPQKEMKEQFEKLVFNPLLELKHNQSSKSRTIIIIIDALDECEDEQHTRTILRLLSQNNSMEGVNLRLFITSRPELPIVLGFQRMNGDVHKDVLLHDVPVSVVDHDLHAFLQDEMAQIRRDQQLPRTWPGDANIRALIETARPLFIFAATVCRFVADERLGDARDLLDDVLRYRAAGQTSKLGGTYLPVLRRLLAGLDRSSQQRVIERFRLTVGTIVTLVDSLPGGSIAKLLDVNIRDIESLLRCLHSVLRVPNNPKVPVQLLHLSFRDFLLDKEQCETDFWIDEKATHAKTATKCIAVMSTERGLRENICGLEYPGKLRSEVASEIINNSLPAELQYACRYWVHHLQRGECSIHDGDEVHNFLKKHFLHLLEALGILGKISESIAMITTLQLLLSVSLDYYITRLHLLTISRPTKAYSVPPFLMTPSAFY